MKNGSRKTKLSNHVKDRPSKIKKQSLEENFELKSVNIIQNKWGKQKQTCPGWNFYNSKLKNKSYEHLAM